jgi:integrase
MATVYIQKRTRKEGKSYAVKFADPLTGRKRHYATARRLRDAQTKANELRDLLDSGTIPESKSTRLNPLTLDEVATSLREEWDARQRRGELSEKTVEEYSYWLGVLKKVFGHVLLCQLTERDILGYRDAQIERSSVVTANRHLFIFRCVFKHGLALRAVLSDPTANIKFLSERAHQRNSYLDPVALDKLVTATQETKAKFYLPALIYLGAEHGASKQECLSLEWAHVDFDFADVGKIRFFRTKNKRERTEFLMPRTREALLAWKKHLDYMRHRKKIKEVTTELVFCRLDGTPIKRIDTAWRRACETAGIKDFRFHDLRHTFCSSIILSGAGLKEAKEMIGHADIAMTDRYSHLPPLSRLQIQKKLAEYYGGNFAADQT